MAKFPTEKKQKRIPISVEIEDQLLKLVKEEAKSRGLTMRQIIEYGLYCFIETCENEKEIIL